MIRVAIDNPGPWFQRLGARRYEMPVASFTGATSVAGYVEATRGSVLGVGLLPEGWARLFGGDLSVYANRVMSLTELDPAAEALPEALQQAEHPPTVFEQWIEQRLSSGLMLDPMISRIRAMIDDPAVTRIEAIAEALGVSPRQLASMTRYYFGFTPKVLLRRGRFLRALGATLDASPESTAALLGEAGYWDRSHFLRDAHLFLGCSIREFRRRRGALSAEAMKVRAAVIGAPV